MSAGIYIQAGDPHCAFVGVGVSFSDYRLFACLNWWTSIRPSRVFVPHILVCLPVNMSATYLCDATQKSVT